ncbi:hypothetical protein MYCODSM44623_00755 [Mycobacterium intracellulare subsp. chimaera]|nr:hypothetical protein MYCODSM44623_00755 [Mycobacterium intracellulare subsp. chimaera]
MNSPANPAAATEDWPLQTRRRCCHRRAPRVRPARVRHWPRFAPIGRAAGPESTVLASDLALPALTAAGWIRCQRFLSPPCPLCLLCPLGRAVRPAGCHLAVCRHRCAIRTGLSTNRRAHQRPGPDRGRHRVAPHRSPNPNPPARRHRLRRARESLNRAHLAASQERPSQARPSCPTATSTDLRPARPVAGHCHCQCRHRSRPENRHHHPV